MIKQQNTKGFWKMPQRNIQHKCRIVMTSIAYSLMCYVLINYIMYMTEEYGGLFYLFL